MKEKKLKLNKTNYCPGPVCTKWSMVMLSSLFLVSDVTLTGNEDKDGPIIADKQLASFAFGMDGSCRADITTCRIVYVRTFV